jgi:acetyl-CoA acetyltransferase
MRLLAREGAASGLERTLGHVQAFDQFRAAANPAQLLTAGRGIATLCVGGGQGQAAIIRNGTAR